MKYYTFRTLQSELKNTYDRFGKPLPSNRHQLNVMERTGVFPYPKNNVALFAVKHPYGTQEMRIYTMDEIKTIVEKVKDYQDNK